MNLLCPREYIEMFNPSHVDGRGFDKVGLHLATAVTLVLLLQWTGHTLALQKVHACPCGISALSSRSVRSCAHLLEETWRHPYKHTVAPLMLCGNINFKRHVPASMGTRGHKARVNPFLLQHARRWQW